MSSTWCQAFSFFGTKFIVVSLQHKARDLFLACREELASLVTHRFPIQDAEKAFTLYERHEDGILKAVASYWESNSVL